MKVAIVHDFLNQYGGAERVVEAFKDVFPDAPVYTSIFEPHKLSERMREWEVITPKTDVFPFFNRLSKYYTFLLPLMFENFHLQEYDVILSSTAHFAKGVLTRPDQMHICYCHTPPRFLYHYETEINRRKKILYKPILLFLDHYLRVWDYLAAQRVNYFITNSINTKKRIGKFYRRDAVVIYPPVSLDKKRMEDIRKNKGEYLLIVSRLAAYKRIDLAIEACNKLNKKLIIVGTGKEEKRLSAIAGESIEFKGEVPDDVLAEYYYNCQGVIFPGEDDFGIVPIEAMFFGKPVIAYKKGGVLESIIPGKTGEFFEEQTVESLASVLEKFNYQKYNTGECLKQAEKFSKQRFQKEIKSFVEEKWSDLDHA